MSDNARYLLFRAVFFTIYAPIGVMIPFFVLHLQASGLSGREISYVTGIAGITVILFQQLWGYAGDTLISKKSLVMWNILGSGFLFMGIGHMKTFWSIAALTFVFNSLFSSVNQLLHGFLFMDERGESRFGVLRAYASLGFVSANIGVGLISDKLTAGRLDFIFPLFFVICAVASLFILPIKDGPAAAGERPTFARIQAHFLRRKEVRIFLLLAFLYQAAHSLTYVMQSVVLSNMGAERTTIAFCTSLAAIMELPVFFFATRLRNRFGDAQLLAFAAVVQTIRWLVVWQATTPETVILSSMSHCITFGLFYAAAVGYMNSHAGARFKASAQTLMAFVYLGLANVAGNFAGGQLLSGGALEPVVRRFITGVLGMESRGDVHNLYLACSGLAAVSFVIALRLIHVERRRSRARTLSPAA